MAQQDTLILTTLENGIQKVVLNKPAKKNALSISVNKCVKKPCEMRKTLSIVRYN
jgi:enoyl-CoA hydratase/carnithine racemase